MNLTEFNTLLARHADLPFLLLLPGGGEVPQSFHVTEVGHVNKQFVDCGSGYHQSNTVQLQAWVGEDDEHRLLAGKLSRILETVQRRMLPPDAGGFPVEIEYENLELTQFRIAGYDVQDGAVVLRLASKHTDCLAKDKCMTPAASAGTPAAAGCCGGKC
jgi:Family of unknown function (DUF6428)